MSGRAVVVDRERCLGTGICVVYAPDTFAHDEEAKAVVVGPPEPLDAVRTAVEGCPTQALTLAPTDEAATDEEGG
ncbi:MULTISPECIES: ferredoxin [unclassified Streptomyces]|uniref:ferredoxin n=1 Tax=unclassified Streptomyces TaxID=2593676 RepID=UPI00278BB94D|nr:MULTISPECIES: ferredoxin [unclassified Streptomyces]